MDLQYYSQLAEVNRLQKSKAYKIIEDGIFIAATNGKKTAIINFAGETRDDIDKTLKYLEKANPELFKYSYINQHNVEVFF
jgi:hypothetical protein